MSDENENANYDVDGGGLKKRLLVTLIVFVAVVLVAFVTASLIKTYVTETFTVDGTSMLPTLSGGVSGDITDGDRVVVNHYAKIKRGNIVVLRLEGRENALVKRAVAVAGDVVKIEGGLLYVNGEAQSTDFLSDENKIMHGENTEEFTVSENCIFVLGDNRNASMDSRSFGEVPLSQVAGKVFMVLREGGGFYFTK